MNELMKIEKKEISGEIVDVVNARELWKKLEIKSDFSTWAKRRIAESQLVENQDFTSFFKIEERGIGASTKTEYALTLDSAKHFAMLERNEVGKKIRQYFIDVEKKAKIAYKTINALTFEELAIRKMKANMEVAALMEIPKHIALIEVSKMVKADTGVDYEPLLLKSPIMDNIQEQEKMLEPTELGKILDITPRDVNFFIESLGWQYKKRKNWIATKEGQKYCKTHSWENRGKSGYNYKWNVEAVVMRWQNRNNW